MNLSHKLTFSIFSTLLVAAFVVAPTAMAQVTVEGYQVTTTADDTSDPKVTGKVVFTFTYSETLAPRPTLAHFTANDDVISQPDDTENPAQRDVLTASYTEDSGNTVTAAIGGTGKTVTLTLTGSTTTTPAIPAGLMLRGYSTDLSSGFSTDMENQTALELVDGYIGGKTYVVYVRGTSAADVVTPLPHLPTVISGETPSANSQILRTIFAGENSNSNVAIPNLESFFFEGGGTIDLNVMGTGRDSRQLVINEIMWAVDNRLVGEDDYTSQQWIEVYNPFTTPAPAPTFNFINNSGGLNPPAAIAEGTADRLTNIGSFINTWNVKGQNGTSTVVDATANPTVINGAMPMFQSMYRNDIRGGNEGSGGNASNWIASDTGRPYRAGFAGTPGAANTRASVPGTRPAPSAANPAMDKVLINEVYDAPGGNNMNDWLELRALKDTNLENWELSYVDGTDNDNNGVGDEHDICFFPKRTIKAGEIWLIVNKDPTESGIHLAAGNDVTIPEADNRSPGRGDAKYLVVSDFMIPSANNGDYLLVLRSRRDRNASRANLEDVVGTGTFEKRTRNLPTVQREPHTGNPGQIWETKIFPLNGQNPGDYHKDQANSLLENKWTFTPGVAWYRLGNNKGWLRDAGRHHGNRGGIGYDRAWSGDAHAAGTPGYPNDAYKEFAAAAADNVYISEIMYAHDGTAQAPPQWIELHNPSRTVSVNLANFRITIKNHDQTMDADGMMADWGGDAEGTFVLSGMSISPGQTVLIVSASARRDEVSIPDHRIFNIFRTKAAKDALGMKVRGDTIFNPYGFSITLNAKTKGDDGNYSQLADSVGNLADPESDRRGSRERFDPVRWTLPNGFNEDGQRVSIARRKNPVEGLSDGREMSSWILSSHDGRTDRIDIVYYGDDEDISTPGQTIGSPLPVELSFFRPTLENGKVTIQWTTESELDNAGFNILRSDTRDSEFTQVNEQMIQGKGTTAERSTYKWVDTTAKPGAVYYYQIEDVSFAGEYNTLATTKLKGLISAKGKLTTQWGDLKNLR